MSRSIGPRLKVMGALGTELPGLLRKALGERNYPPGQHGQCPKRKAGFGVQLIEKQKLRFNYGLTERQIQRLFREAKRDRGPTGDKLLERRVTTSCSAPASRPPPWRLAVLSTARRVLNRHMGDRA